MFGTRAAASRAATARRLGPQAITWCIGSGAAAPTCPTLFFFATGITGWCMRAAGSWSRPMTDRYLRSLRSWTYISSSRAALASKRLRDVFPIRTAAPSGPGLAMPPSPQGRTLPCGSSAAAECSCRGRAGRGCCAARTCGCRPSPLPPRRRCHGLRTASHARRRWSRWQNSELATVRPKKARRNSSSGIKEEFFQKKN
jgi:hypothetical protein